MMPPHRVYIEPFMGGAAILRLKRPAALNIAMDLYRPAVDAFLELASLKQASGDGDVPIVGLGGADRNGGSDGGGRRDRVSPDPASRDLAGSAELARNGGASGSARVTIADTTRLSDSGSALAKSDGRRRRAPSSKAMPPAASPKWTILQADGLEFLETLSPDLANVATVVYCDPPYLRSTRSSGRLYEHEMSDVDHRRLLRWAIAAKCRVMISGYWSRMYGSTLRNWRCSRFQAMTRGGLAEECVWSNFPEPAELHDYRYLGEGFRERERIKRKTTRWTARLARMPLLERRCLLAALEQVPVLVER